MAKRTTPRTRGAGSIALPDEKRIKSTSETIPVENPKVAREAKERIAPVAVDRRRQVIQTSDELNEGECPPAKRRRKK